jgi:hypothetical protein
MTHWQADPRQIADPFDEQAPLALRRRHGVLGASVEFRSDSPELSALADTAYAGLPGLPGDAPPLVVELRLAASAARFDKPPPVARMLGGAGLLGATVDAANLALVNPAAGRALVRVSPGLLRWPYHLRYELIEFAVFTLVARQRHLAALHAGCVAAGGQAALLMGASGAGKSTLALQSMALGLSVLTEDASFVDAGSFNAWGVPNFLHLRCDGLGWLSDPVLSARIQASPVIQRRSGVCKFELDLRAGWAPIAAGPVPVRHLVFAAAETAAGGELLQPLAPDEALARLRLSQPYAAGQPGWGALAAGAASLHAWSLRRGRHPQDGARALRSLLMA